MNTTKKSLAVAATALAGLAVAMAPAASASTSTAVNKTFNEACQVAPFGPQTLKATVTGTVPDSVVHGTTFKLTQGKFKVIIPASLNATAYGSGGRYMKVTFHTVNLTTSNASPSTKDVFPTDYTTGFVAVPANSSSTFTAPGGTSYLTPSFTAKTAGTPIKIKVGNVEATYTLYNSTKTAVLPNQAVTCAAPKSSTGTPIVIATIPVT